MENSGMVTTKHLIRKAIVYIRQSHPNSVVSHQESLHLQYALKQRAINLGWREDDIQTIDSDLGLTATSAQNREGFKELVSQVTSGQVGVILAYDVTRLSRNCSDWYPLLESVLHLLQNSDDLDRLPKPKVDSAQSAMS